MWRSKQQTITGTIKGLFRQAAKTATRDEDEEPTEKKRKGETEGEFRRFARAFVRRFDMRAAFRGRTVIMRRAPVSDPIITGTASLYQTAFDQLSAINDEFGFIETMGESFDGPQQTFSLEL